MSTLDVGFLWVDRETRQRSELNEDHILELADSFLRIGQLTPILCKPSGEIIHGEHRWMAAKSLGWTSLKGEVESSNDDDLHQAMELEENIKRVDMLWQDKAFAINRYHENRLKNDPTWTQEKTGEALGLSPNDVSRNIKVAQELPQDDPKIKEATTLTSAYNVILRRESRERDSEVVRALAIDKPGALRKESDGHTKLELPSIQDFAGPAESVLGTTAPPVPALIQPDHIFEGNFLTWAPHYEGPKFNFLHCDFPYGVNIDKSEQANADTRGAYKDTPETYWALLECLAENWHRIMLPSSHIMFWFSMDFYTETYRFFQEKIPSLELDVFPLYWHKSDGKGILPDAARGPRRIVETCFFGRSGDRKIVQAVGNGYSCPTQKNQALHISEKPEPMLRHFMKMIVDENTAMLDPTCGGGSALRAADSLKATRILGLELNPEYAEIANVALKRSQMLRKATGI